MTNIVATLAAQNRSDLIVTGDSDIVTAHSDDPSKSVTIKSESAVTLAETAVTLFRNERSRWGGICIDAGAFKEGTLNHKVAGEPPLRALVTFSVATRPYVAHPRMKEPVFKALQASLLNIKSPEAFRYLAKDSADGLALVEDAEYDRMRAAIQRNPEFFRQ